MVNAFGSATWPLDVPLKPKFAVAPGAMALFQPTGLAVTFCLLWVISACQRSVIFWLSAKDHLSSHGVMVAAPVFFRRTWVVKPPLHR